MPTDIGLDGQKLPGRLLRLTPEEAWDFEHIPEETAPVEWLRKHPTGLTGAELEALRPDENVWAPKDTRRRAVKLWIRDGGICQICGLAVDISLRSIATQDGGATLHPAMASVDHVVPGGGDWWGNLQLAHRWCNTVRNDNPPTIIAVQTYRDQLAKAIEAAPFRATPEPLVRRNFLARWLWTPVVDENWRAEVEHGRPAGEWGEEWTVPAPAHPYQQREDFTYPEGLYGDLLEGVSERSRASFIRQAREKGFDRDEVERYLAARRRPRPKKATTT
ncbi:hypothetical protein V6N00_13710 [Tersicoccus sp. MR15.9]|uniref:HNH endonuclease n=1 Tax=Tersicoccus mangrovi TaxID=3121635 RepID=UPI002FE62E8A